eukprot:gene13464-13579_t
MTDLRLTLSPESPDDAEAVEKLNERAFGPGRFARSAYRLREHNPPDLTLSFVAYVGTLLVGSNCMTAIRCGTHPALLLGPLTVDPAFRQRGIGAALIKASLDAAKAQGHTRVVLVGDEPYYKRFGFQRVGQGRLIMPGPVDPRRLLVCELTEGAFEGVSGQVTGA